MKLLIVALILLMPKLSYADEWTKTDTALQATFGTIVLIDYIQTRQIIRNKTESNPFIGSHGQVGSPGFVIGTTFVLHTAAAYFLPQPYRRYFQFFSIGADLQAVTRNFQLGYTIKW